MGLKIISQFWTFRYTGVRYSDILLYKLNYVCSPPEHRFINQDKTQVADVWLVTAKSFDKTCTRWTPSQLNLSQFTILKMTSDFLHWNVFLDCYHVRELWSVNPNRILTHSQKETCTFVVVSVVIIVVITVIIAITVVNVVWPQNYNNPLNDHNVFILQWVERVRCFASFILVTWSNKICL